MGNAPAASCIERCNHQELSLHRWLRERDPDIPLLGLQSSSATGFVSTSMANGQTRIMKMRALLRELTRCPLETKSSLVLCPIFLSTRPLSNIS